MTIIDVEHKLLAQTRWKTLRAESPATVLQFFADYSPESWWHTRYIPSTRETKSTQLGTSSISRRGFQSQVNLGLISVNPRYVIFHRRTITSRVYFDSIGHFPNVHPLFVIPTPEVISKNPTMPLPEWVRMLEDCREGRCTLVVEDESGIASLGRLGAKRVMYLPPLAKLPENFRTEGKSPSDRKRILVCVDSYPAYDLLSMLLRIHKAFPEASLQLRLGEGFDATQENYRDGLIEAARMLFESIEIWPWMPRTNFLRKVGRDVDMAVVCVSQAELITELSLLEIPMYGFRPNHEDSQLWGFPGQKWTAPFEVARSKFWRELT